MTRKFERLDIVGIISDDNTYLTNSYQNKVVQKIKETFTSEEEKLFVASFESYLKYNDTDFIIYLIDVWKWLGYSRMDPCKAVLLKNFKENIDYVVQKAAPEISGAGPKVSMEGKNLGGAGLNKESIILTISCFKKLCLKSRTDQADKIHDYYAKLENTIFQAMKEETQELRHQLAMKDKQVNEIELNIQLANEKNLLMKHSMKRCFYIIKITECLLKFGITNNIEKRLATHKKEISPDIILFYVIDTVYNGIIENKIKELCNNKNDILFNKRISKDFFGKNQTELIELNNTFTIDHFWNKVLTIDKNINKDEVFLQLEAEVESLKNKKEIVEEKDNNIYNYIYLQSTNIVNQYVIDLSNDPNKTKDIYESTNCNQIKKLTWTLLEAYHVRDNIFELPYNAIKDTLEYCIMTYDKYKINKNDVYRFNYIHKYVTRHTEDKIIIKEEIKNNIIDTDVYQKYIEENIEYGSSYKVPICLLYDDIKKWTKDSKFDSVSEKDLKEEITKVFEKITDIKKTIICVTINDKKYSTYPGFVGFRIKEETTAIYPEEIYRNFLGKHVEYTGKQTDRVFRSVLCDNFVEYIANNHILHQDTKGAQRYKIGFLNEFNTMFKKIFDVDYNQELRTSANKKHLHGGFECCKFKDI